MDCFVQPLFLNGVTIGGSVRKEEDNVGFSLKYGDVILGLDCLSVNDKTLWMSKLSDALSNYATTEKKFLTKQKSGEFLVKYFVDSGSNIFVSDDSSGRGIARVSGAAHAHYSEGGAPYSEGGAPF